MPEYNPNSIWTGKKKDPAYQPATEANKAAEAKATAPMGGSGAASRSGSTLDTPKGAFFKKTPLSHFDEEPVRRGRALLWAGIVFGVLVVGGLAYFFFLRAPAGPNVSIEFSKPDQVLTGDPFAFTISFSNYSNTILKNVDLSVILPDNVSFVGQTPGQRVMEQQIGDLGPGSINKQEFKLIVTGNPNSIKHIDAKLAYGTDAASKSPFETDGGVDLVVGGPAISVNFNTPVTVYSGQDFDTTVTYTNNTSHSFQAVSLSVQYPPVFKFSRSTVPPGDAGNHSWDLGTIPAAGTGSFTITGSIIGPSGAKYTLDGNLTGVVLGNTYGLTDQTADLTVGSSPLTIAVTVNDSTNYVSRAGDSLRYRFTYSNNSNVTFQNVSINAALVGDMFDFTSLRSNGSFNSITNSVNWYAANTPDLLNVAPGQSGYVELIIATKESFPIKRLSDKNYSVKATGQIASPTVPPGTVGSSTVSVVSTENKLGGAVSFAAKGFWRDAPSGILNTGPYPPKVNQATQYTVHWIITNYSTDLQNVTVSGYLQSGTTCTGKIKSNIGNTPTCNPQNGLLTWTIPSIPATTGIASPPAEAIFQVVNTPAINQLGQSIILAGATTLQATDAFTGAALSGSGVAITTDMQDDKTISGSTPRQVTR